VEGDHLEPKDLLVCLEMMAYVVDPVQLDLMVCQDWQVRKVIQERLSCHLCRLEGKVERVILVHQGDKV